MSNIKNLVRNKYFVFFGSIFVLFLLLVQFRQYSVRHNVQKEIDSLSKQADQLQKNNQDLQSMIAYLKTDDYKEKTAREQLSMRKEGENVYSFSENVPVAQTSQEAAVAIAQQKRAAESNPKKWWDYFFKTN